MTSVRILGPIEAWAQHRRLDLGGRRQLALFAFLVLHANRAVSRDALIDAVWGSDRSSSDTAGFKLVKCSAVDAVDREVVAAAVSDLPELKRVANRAAVRHLCLGFTAR